MWRCFLALLAFNVTKTRSFQLPNPPETQRIRSAQSCEDLSSTSSELNRRTFVTNALVASTAASPFLFPFPAYATSLKYAQRLQDDKLLLPPPSYASELNGVDNTYFPNFMAGTWDVTQTLVGVQTPLGLKFAGGPQGDLKIAEETMKQSQQQLNVPVKLQLRYIPTKWGIAEDRLFNTQQRLNAFAGKSVVAAVDYANVGGSNRASVLAMGGTEQDPLQTTVTRFKGPAAQKSFVVSHGGDPINSSGNNNNDREEWSGYELQRSIFALTNQNTAPPITTDSELIWQLTPIDANRVQGKFRIAGYLNAQNDKLYFEAGKRAVTLQDYTLDMIKVKD